MLYNVGIGGSGITFSYRIIDIIKIRWYNQCRGDSNEKNRRTQSFKEEHVKKKNRKDIVTKIQCYPTKKMYRPQMGDFYGRSEWLYGRFYAIWT